MIGDPRVKLVLSKTKNHAVPVGLSLLLLLLKVEWPSKLVLLKPTLNNNSLTVLKTVTTDVTEVSWTTLSNGTKTTPLTTKKTTNTPLEMENANNLNTLLLLPKLLVTLMSPKTVLINSWLLLTKPSSLLPSKLINQLGNSTTLVS